MRLSFRTVRIAAIVIFLLALVTSVFAFFRYREIVSITGPTISMDEDTVIVSIHDDESALLAGITAEDRHGRDVTDLLVVESLGYFSTPGTRQVRIAAFDRDGNVTKATRTVIYSDYVRPRISLSDPLIVLSGNTATMLNRIHVTDCLDGDISQDVIVSMADGPDHEGHLTSSSYVGTLDVVIQITNSAGDTVRLPVTAEYIGAGDHDQIELSEYLVYLDRGQTLDPVDWLSGMVTASGVYSFERSSGSFLAVGHNGDPIRLSSLQILNPVDPDVPGVYEVTYSYILAGRQQAQVRLVVIVEEGGDGNG